MDYINRWLELKQKERLLSLKAPVEVAAEFKRVTGGRSLYGKVVVSATPSAEFSFNSLAVWPQDDYDEYVMLGILDTLLASDLHPVLGCAFVLKEIGWHEVDSCAYGYYMAARQATADILRRGEYSSNINHNA